MRFLALFFPLLLLPGLAAAATKVPNRDFTLEVSVSLADVVGFYSVEYDWYTGRFVRSNPSPVSLSDYRIFTSFSFDSSVDIYEIIGSVLVTDDYNGVFTYDFATMRGVYEVGDLSSTTFSGVFSFKAGGYGNLYYLNDNIPTYTEEEIGWSNTTVTLTLAPVPLPAGLPLLAAGLSCLCCLGLWRNKSA